jgi:tRNA pseudouridine38/39 synthase
MSNEIPLCFFDCAYRGNPLKWQLEANAFQSVRSSLLKTWTDLQSKASIVKAMVTAMDAMLPADAENDSDALEAYILNRPKPKKYVPILKRPLCDSLETKIDKVAKKLCSE